MVGGFSICFESLGQDGIKKVKEGLAELDRVWELEQGRMIAQGLDATVSPVEVFFMHLARFLLLLTDN